MRPAILSFRRLSAVAAAAFLFASPAEAAPWRVAVLGPDESPVVARLQRNVAAMHMEAVSATVNVCTRDVITRLLGELRVTSALCADGDAVAIWVKENDKVVLKDVIVSQGADDRTQEVTAARAAMALRSLPAKDAPPADPNAPAVSTSSSGGVLTIVANGSGATVTTTDPNAIPNGSPAGKDEPAKPPRPTPPQPERIAPRLLVGLGPGTTTSHNGTSFALSLAAEIGVSRYVSLVPWFSYVPATRDVSRPEGTAEFRPTVFGLGFGIPILRNSSFVVPRIGGGYGIVWLHVSPETAVAPAQTKKPEDLLAPMIYTSAAVSFKITDSFRIGAEGLVGTASHHMVVRIARQTAGEWGVPIANLSLRGEWVIP